MRKKNMKQKHMTSKSSSETDLLVAMKGDSNNGVDRTATGGGTDQNFNQCPAEKGSIHDQKGWLKRGFKKAFHKKSNMKVIGNIAGVGMVAAASGGIISNNTKDSGQDDDCLKGEHGAPCRIVPTVQVTNTS